MTRFLSGAFINVTPEPELPALMPVLKAARVSGISKTRFYKLIANGKLKACYVGAHMRVHRDDLRRCCTNFRRSASEL